MVLGSILGACEGSPLGAPEGSSVKVVGGALGTKILGNPLWKLDGAYEGDGLEGLVLGLAYDCILGPSEGSPLGSTEGDFDGT